MLNIKKVLVISLVSLIATLLYEPAPASQEMVTLCHKPGTPAEQTLILPESAVPGHMGHGDTLGECGGGGPQ
jgi:hypothetical protein